jgi:hypothetical protein
MVWDEEAEWQRARGIPAPEWYKAARRGWEDPRPAVVGLDYGAHASGPQLDQPWLPFQANGMANPDASGAATSLAAPELPPAPPPAAGDGGAGIGGSGAGLTPRPAPEPRGDPGELFRAQLAADCLQFERKQTTGAILYLDRLDKWGRAYLARLKEAL